MFDHCEGEFYSSVKEFRRENYPNELNKAITQWKKNHIERICSLYTKPLSWGQYLHSNYNINTEY